MIDEHCNATSYLTKGYRIIPLHQSSKRPKDNEWNVREYTDKDFNSNSNIGLNHVQAGTVCLDVDDKLLATPLLKYLGLKKQDFKYRYTAREDRFKNVFRMPKSVRSLTVRKLGVAGKHILEIRATGQDVLPGSIHPEGGTYALVDGGELPPLNELPEIPAPLLNLYLNWREMLPEIMANVYKIETPKQQRSSGDLGQPALRRITLFNETHDLVEILLAHGYEGSGDRYMAPGSETNIPGVVVYDDNSTCYSNHGAHDPLADGFSHDAFDCMRLLQFKGSMRQALEFVETLVTPNQAAEWAADDFEGVSTEIPPDEEEPTGGFDLMHWNTLPKGGEAPRQLVEDFLVYGQSTLISAQPNTGKSAFALDLAEHVAAGIPWYGREVEQGAVLYVAAESPETIKARMLAARMRRGGSLPLYATRDNIVLTTPEDRRTFTKKLKATLKQIQEKVVLVIVDTYRAATPGIEENSAEAMGPVVNYLHRLAPALDANVFTVHHTTKAGLTYAGSGVFGAIIDTEIMVRDETDTDIEENRGCIVATVLQQRGLATRWAEFMYRIDGYKTGRTTNFGKAETAPLVKHITVEDLERELQEEAENNRELERAQLLVDLDQLVTAMRNGCSSRGEIMAATGMSERRLTAVRQFGLDEGVLGVEGEGRRRRYYVVGDRQ